MYTQEVGAVGDLRKHALVPFPIIVVPVGWLFDSHRSHVDGRVDGPHRLGKDAEVASILVAGDDPFPRHIVATLPFAVILVADFPVADVHTVLDVGVTYPLGGVIGSALYWVLAGAVARVAVVDRDDPLGADAVEERIVLDRRHLPSPIVRGNSRLGGLGVSLVHDADIIRQVAIERGIPEVVVRPVTAGEAKDAQVGVSVVADARRIVVAPLLPAHGVVAVDDLEYVGERVV